LNHKNAQTATPTTSSNAENGSQKNSVADSGTVAKTAQQLSIRGKNKNEKNMRRMRKRI